MKKFCLDLKGHATKIINYERKEMIPLTKEEKEIHDMQKVYYICKRIFSTDYNNKNIIKQKTMVIIQSFNNQRVSKRI